MDVPELAARTSSHFRDHADAFGMESSSVRASYVLNPDDFALSSFLITDGKSASHLKLVQGAELKLRLRKWRKCQPILEERYRAPQIINWVDLPGTEYAGLLFLNIDGVHPDFRKPSLLLEEVLCVMDNLHNDEELAEKLGEMEERRCLADSFSETWTEPIKDKLAAIEQRRPSFVSSTELAWMRGEASSLECAVRASSEFLRFATKPIHGHLVPRGILVTRNEDWYLVNWAHLALGDPAIDYACLLWPLFTNDGLKVPGQNLPIPSHDPGFARRLALCLRALSLEAVVGVLANYVTSEIAPDHTEIVQMEKWKEYETNLANYRRRFS